VAPIVKTPFSTGNKLTVGGSDCDVTIGPVVHIQFVRTDLKPVWNVDKAGLRGESLYRLLRIIFGSIDPDQFLIIVPGLDFVNVPQQEDCLHGYTLQRTGSF
jgi:hypothetical protein